MSPTHHRSPKLPAVLLLLALLLALPVFPLPPPSICIHIRTTHTHTHTDRINARRYVCNLADKEAIYAAATRVHAEVGDVDVVVNNAGVVQGSYLLDPSNTDAKNELTFAVNTMAHFWMAKAFLGMCDGWGTSRVMDGVRVVWWMGYESCGGWGTSRVMDGVRVV